MTTLARLDDLHGLGPEVDARAVVPAAAVAAPRKLVAVPGAASAPAPAPAGVAAAGSALTEPDALAAPAAPAAPAARVEAPPLDLVFWALHLGCIPAIWLVGVSWQAVLLCFGLYYLRMFGITAGYHRFFSHRTYKTSRVFQFLLAAIGSAAMQKGPLWWASHHRHHHRFSDTEHDIHSPTRRGFWWAHLRWFLSDDYIETDWQRIGDFRRYPELVWLNRYHYVPGIAALAVLALTLGWQMTVWGGLVSTVLCWHGTFTINSLAHVFGKRVYETTDTSRNSFLLALITMGEGWHNNHHYYQASANQGFHWWQVDPSFYLLVALEKIGLVWDVKRAPREAIEGRWGGRDAKIA